MKNKSNNESGVEQQKSQREKTPLEKVIQNKINSIGFLRGNRIELSNRLGSYSNKWKFILFFINVEAVIIVLLTLTNTIETIQIGQFNMRFDLIAGIFTLYVILLQYYVNSLNYNERTLRVHYHQLEIEDLNQELRILLLKMNTKEIDIHEKEIIENYDRLVDQYQLAIKNNENHRDIDFKRTKYDIAFNAYERDKLKAEPEGKRSPGGPRPKDFTLDMALIYANTLLSVSMLFVIAYVVIF